LFSKGNQFVFILLLAGCAGTSKLTNSLTYPERVTQLNIKNSHNDNLPAGIAKLKELTTLYRCDAALFHLCHESAAADRRYAEWNNNTAMISK
jgi:hypothetical protein